MTGTEIFALYSGILTLMLLGMIIQIIRIRRSEKIAYGDGGNTKLLKAMRGQANFAETVPIALILLLALALLGAPNWALHALGFTLIVGRLCHAIKFLGSGSMALRQVGMGLTLIYLIIAACMVIALSVV